jgi:type I restriction enzyme, S subunit
MGSEWRTVSFGQLIDEGVLEIGDGYRAKNAELGGDGPIFLRAGHVRDTHIDLDGVDRFHRDLADVVASKMSAPGDVVVTTKGNSTGRVAFIDDRMPPVVYSPHLSYWRSRRRTALVPGFLRYWSRGVQFQDQLSGLASSTDMAPYLSLVDQKRLRISLPTPAEQERIACVLGALDDKIDLNRRMSQTLESMARALYKSWFVDFDPVRAKSAGTPGGLPTDLVELLPSGFCTTVIGEIPDGWQVGELGLIGVSVGEQTDPSTVDAATPYFGLEHMPRGSIALFDWATASAATSAKLAFRRGAVLFGKLRPYFHKAGVAPVDGLCSTDIIVMEPTDPGWFGLLLGTVTSDALLNEASSGTTGTRMPRTSWAQLAAHLMAVPPRDLALRLDAQVRPLVGRIHAAVWEARALAGARDRVAAELLGANGASLGRFL